jgi:hypothetical protein
MEAMNDLNKIITELNAKLNKMGRKLFTKTNTIEIKDESLNNINANYTQPKLIDNNISNNNNMNLNPNINDSQIVDISNTNKNDNNIVENNDNSEDIIKKQYTLILENLQGMNKSPTIELEEDEIKDRIKSLIYDRFLTKVFLWLHKYSANYKNIEKDTKMDFEIETIKGETKIKSIIESDINLALSIIDLSGLDKNDMKEIEKLIKSYFNSKNKQSIEEEKYRKKKASIGKNKFHKFSKNLLKLNRFAKMVTDNNQNSGTNGSMKYNGKIDIVKLFQMQTEKEREEKIKKEEELEQKRKKLEYIEELFETKLFKKYLTTSYQLTHIFLNFLTCFINNFSWVCYFFMIVDHMLSASLITLFYPLSIFCYALLEYPRPKKSYWIAVLFYTMGILFVKFIIHLKLAPISEDKYSQLIENLYSNKIGLRYFSSTFSMDFIQYIIFDIFVVLTISINRNLLLSDGLWFKREE